MTGLHMKGSSIARAALLCGVSLSAVALNGAPAQASSHREAPGITLLPKVDGTDFYMFRSYEPGRDGFVTLVANYQPAQTATLGAPNYFQLDADALYEIKIDNDGDGREDISFQFRFTNERRNLAVNVGGVEVPIALVQDGTIGVGGDPADNANLNVVESYTLSLVRGGRAVTITDADTGSKSFSKPADNIGQKTLPDYAAYAAAQVHNIKIPGCGVGKVFVGQRKDSFVVNLSETFDLVNIAHPVGEAFANAGRDDLASSNVTALELEVPIGCLVAKDPVIGAWTTAGTLKHRDGDDDRQVDADDFAQQSRLGMPLVNELFVGLKDKDKFNASEPRDDAQFLIYFTNPTITALIASTPFLGSFGFQAPTLIPRADLVAAYLTGIGGINQPANVKRAEMLRLNTATPVTPAPQQSRLGVIGGDMAGFPNGRRPGDDIVDVTLRVRMGRLISLKLFGDPSQAPSGALDFTDGATVDASFFDTRFPYLKPPIPASPAIAAPSKPLPVDPVPGPGTTVSAE
jgi:hypothetical protein